MARQIRIEYAGAAYRVMAQGNQGRPIYADDLDRKRWLETVGEACEKTGWRIHAYVMMSNHYHLLVQTPEANLVAGMKWLQSTYTQRYNSRHALFGVELGIKAGRKRLDEEWKMIRRGWFLGGDGFRGRLVKLVKQTLAVGKKASYVGLAKQAHGQMEAERSLAEGLEALGVEANPVGEGRPRCRVGKDQEKACEERHEG